MKALLNKEQNCGANYRSLADVKQSCGEDYKDFKIQVVNKCAVVTAIDKRDNNRYVVDTIPLALYVWPTIYV